jgi:low temperature requirement protein LtrA
VTVLTAANLDASGVARSVLLFWLIWWAWTQFTWTLNPADTDHDLVRVITLVATAAAFLMAASVTGAFGDDVFWFTIPYLAVRALGLGLQLRIDKERAETVDGTVARWVALSVGGLVCVLAGSFVDPPARSWIWLLAVLADLFAAARASRGRDWDISPAHFSERHGLFVIIALGESLIVGAAAVSAEPRTAALMGDVIAALVVACLLWWTYFGWLKEALEHGLKHAPRERTGALASTAFSLGHFPLVCGIVAFAVALEEIVHHPAHPPAAEVVVALGAGAVLFVGFSAFALYLVSGVVLVPRLVVLAVTMLALAAVSSQAPVWQLAVVAAGLLVIVVIERRGPARAGAGRAAADDLPLSD